MPEKFMEGGRRRRSIMHTFKIDEISAVDAPAQRGARAVIMKRDGGSDAGETLDLFASTAGDMPPSREKADHEADIGKNDRVREMPDTIADDLSAELEKRDRRIADLEVILSMEPHVRAHYEKLSASKQREFLSLDDFARSDRVAKAAEADSVVYTADNGDEFRKSDDPRLVKMARERDEERRQAEKYRIEAERADLCKRANDELGSVPGSELAKSELIRTVDGIEDEEVRSEVGKILKACEKVFKMAMSTRGVSSGAGVSESAQDQIDRGVRKIMDRDGITESEAYSKYLSSPEGRRAYDVRRAERLAQN